MTREEAIRELKIQFVGEYDRQREAKDRAIEALQQQTCDNCKFNEETDGMNCYECVKGISDNFEALQQETEWIPVTEKLPKYRQIVIVSSYWGVNTAYRDSAREDGTDDFWELIERDSTAAPVYIYAWMPLPEPYKESDEQ